MMALKILRTSALAALAAAPLIAAMAQSTAAQKVVAATCPQGYALSGNRCVQTGPTAQVSSPAAKSSSGGQWAFVTRDAFGVKSVKELDGANFCAVTGSAADDAEQFFKDNGISATHIEVDNDRAGIEKYQQYDCDLLVVADRIAVSTAEGLEPKGSHFVLPEKFGEPAPVERVEPPATKKQPAPAKAATTQQAKPKQVRRVRCSAVRYGYTRGNTCACAGGRVFNGHACVRPRW